MEKNLNKIETNQPNSDSNFLFPLINNLPNTNYFNNTNGSQNAPIFPNLNSNNCRVQKPEYYVNSDLNTNSIMKNHNNNLLMNNNNIINSQFKNSAINNNNSDSNNGQSNIAYSNNNNNNFNSNFNSNFVSNSFQNNFVQPNNSLKI